jgi:hypothetical protein
MDVNERISYECSDEGSYTDILRTLMALPLVYMHQKKKISAKIASVNWPLGMCS